ncbi:hypothetical protein EII34_11025 [Arachnia propionica]|uniref:Uncharacterized protein n=1 Tax=Arachnia propionica TaxID=1750 RepID=A0A3P1T3P3_9ACTN|nr:hypothetical protein [Arachnia propionica]RRD04132.1 hypothetical protein EII34_11025 [Arachnia propionica]
MTTPHPASALPTTPRPRRGLVITTALLALALIVSLAFNVLHITHPTGSSTDRSFASPREAAEFYVTALGEGQVQELIEAQASTTLVEHYDIKAALDQFNGTWVYQPYSPSPLPLQGEITTELWTQQFRSGATTIVTRQLATLTATKEVDLDRPVHASPDEILATFDATHLKDLEIKQLRVVADHGPALKAILEKEQRVTSAQATSEVLIELNSGHMLAIGLIQYDDRWFITPWFASVVATTAGLPPHRVAPFRKDGFAEVIANLEQQGITFE